MLVQYIRDKERRPIGCMVALGFSRYTIIGYSLCNTKKDKFNKTLGKDIAYNRAYKMAEARIVREEVIGVNPSIPNNGNTEKICMQVDRFVDRACKYYRVNEAQC